MVVFVTFVSGDSLQKLMSFPFYFSLPDFLVSSGSIIATVPCLDPDKGSTMLQPHEFKFHSKGNLRKFGKFF